MAHQYSKLTERYCELKTKKALKWDEIRKDYKSDAGAERAWDRTFDGIEQMVIKGKLDSIDKKMMAYRRWQDALNLEVRNQV